MLCSSVRFDSEKGNVSFVESNAILFEIFYSKRKFSCAVQFGSETESFVESNAIWDFLHQAGGFRLGSSRVLCSSVRFGSEKRT